MGFLTEYFVAEGRARAAGVNTWSNQYRLDMHQYVQVPQIGSNQNPLNIIAGIIEQDQKDLEVAGVRREDFHFATSIDHNIGNSEWGTTHQGLIVRAVCNPEGAIELLGNDLVACVVVHEREFGLMVNPTFYGLDEGEYKPGSRYFRPCGPFEGEFDFSKTYANLAQRMRFKTEMAYFKGEPPRSSLSDILGNRYDPLLRVTAPVNGSDGSVSEGPSAF